MDSKIYLSEKVSNKDRKFGAWNTYYPTTIYFEDGTELFGFFTLHQIQEATERAKKNPEDIPEGKSLWDTIFG